MADIGIRSSEYCWNNLTLTLLGRRVKGHRGFEFKTTNDADVNRGEKGVILDINDGNESHEGNFKLLGYEVDALNRAAQQAGYKNITKVPHDSVLAVLAFKKAPKDPIKTVQIVGIKFKETGGSMEQGAKSREVTLPWIAIDIIE